MAGSVASAVRFIAKALLVGNVSRILETSNKGAEILRGNLSSDKGMGRDVILSFLDGVPGITSETVKQQLANLKSSGAYARGPGGQGQAAAGGSSSGAGGYSKTQS